MPRHLVYLAHGSRDFIHECCFSIASLQRHHPHHVQVHVFTDQRKYMQQFLLLPVTWHDIYDNTIKEWRGKIDFVHRIKIKVLQTFCKEVREGAVLYMDTDVFARRPFDKVWEEIEDGKFLMHMCEGNIVGSSTPLLKKIVPLITYAVEQGILKTSKFKMWNSGVLGFMAERSDLLEEVLNLTDSLFLHKPKHVIEQMSFSYVFQQKGLVLSTDDVFYHYWKLKEFRQVLKEVYALPAPERDHLLTKMLQENIVERLLTDRNSHYSYLLNRIKKSLFQNRWEIPALEKLMVNFKLL